MADRTLEGIRLGFQIGEAGPDAYNEAKRWQQQMKAKAVDEKREQDEVAYKRSKDRADRFDANVKADRESGYKDREFQLERGKAGVAAETAKKQQQLLDEQITSIKAGKGRYGTGAAGVARVPPEVQVAMSNRDSARKRISALTVAGKDVPKELQDGLSLAENNLRLVAQRNKFYMGEEPKNAVNEPASHPVQDWFARVLGGAAAMTPGGQAIGAARSMFGGVGADSATPPGKVQQAAPRSAFNQETGETIYEPFPGAWGE